MRWESGSADSNTLYIVEIYGKLPPTGNFLFFGNNGVGICCRFNVQNIHTMPYKIEEIEGIGVTYGEKLRAMDIQSTSDLLEKGATKKGREELAKTSGIPENLILTWVNHADLFRIKGVAGQFAELLEAAGVDSVKEFSLRVAENLHEKLMATNNKYGLSGRVPSVEELKSMIAFAKTLPGKIIH
jgi:Domain of unknown function (DUF4332)